MVPGLLRLLLLVCTIQLTILDITTQLVMSAELAISMLLMDLIVMFSSMLVQETPTHSLQIIETNKPVL